MSSSITTQVQVFTGLRRARRARRARAEEDEAARSARRARALDELRAHATARSPFYRELHRGLEGEPLHELPVVSKSDLLARYDEVVTDPDLRLAGLEAFVRTQQMGQRYLGRYWVAGTGGTTGRPALFAFDRDEWVAMMARAGQSRVLAGPPTKARRGRTRYAKVASSLPTHMSRQAGSGLRNPLAPVLRLGATDPLERTVAALDRWQPHGLTAFPSMLRALADEQRDGRLHISPTRVHASAEALTDETRRKVRQAWGTEPFDTYVTTEGGMLAVECTAHAGLHLLDDDVIVEVVDGDRRPVEPGETGSAVLLTTLANRTLPLIRYEITDALRLGDGPCPCGRPGTMVAAIEGRVEDVLHYPSSDPARSAPVAVPPLVFAEALDTAPVGAFQVLGEADRIRILVRDPAPSFSAGDLAVRVTGTLRGLGVSVPVGVEVVAAIPSGPNGKVALVRAVGDPD